MEEEYFSLEDLAHHHNVDVSEFMSGERGTSNKAAAKIVKAMLNDDYTIEQDNNFVLVGRNANEMIDFYYSRKKG